MGMPKTAKRLHKETNQDLINDEVEAIDGYDKAIEGSDSPEAIATYEHIKSEEEEHIEELEGLDKMKADDITSEQAWEDFKSGYTDFEEKHIEKGRDGDQASLEEKIDILSAKISELNTDMSRLTDSVPQALGTIEEGKTLEEEAEENDEETDMFGEEDDGLGEFFDEGEEDAVDDEFIAESEEGDVSDDDAVEDEEEVAEDENVVSDDVSEEEMSDDEDVVDEDAEETDADAEDDGEEVSEEETEDDDEGTSEDMADDDEDYISVDEIMSDDDEEDADEEEVIEKMVAVLDRMDKRIAHLERENAGLKKMLAERDTVQTEPRNLAKSRPRPNTNLKLVKGSYNRPPVSTQYVANQRDIGIGKKKESSENTSVFRQGLNEVFENCERIANQTR